MLKCAAVVGLGSIATRHRANIKAMFEGIQVIALSSSGREVDEVISNADLVVPDMGALIRCMPSFVIVASPSTLHVTHAMAIMRENVPLLIEKPISASFKDADVLQSYFKKHNPLVAVGYCLRFLPSASLVKDLVANNVIGRIYNVSSVVGQFLPQWRGDKDYRTSVSAKKELGGGVLLELSHELDYLQWIFGLLELEYVRLRSTPELEVEVEQVADLILKNEEGIVIYLHQDFIQKAPQRRCTIIGEKGRVEWDLIENSVHIHKQSTVEEVYVDPSWDQNKMYLDMLQNFTGAIDKKEILVCAGVLESVKIVEIIETIKSKTAWG